MSKRVTYGEALRMVQAYNDLQLALINEQRELSEIKDKEKLVMHRNDEVWEFEVEYAAATDEQGVQLVGKARRIK